MRPAVFNWSSGKDSAFALYNILQSKKFDVRYLVTNLNSDFGRVSMHGLPENLLEEQAKAIGIPLYKILFHGEVGMDAYSSLMKSEVQKLIDEGIKHSIYGDIFLQDLKTYRQQLHKQLDIKLEFPLWKRDTRAMIFEFITLGFKAIPVCVNANKLDSSFLGRPIDKNFIKDLPDDVDPCGENGEFHTFVYDGPIFKNPVRFREGDVVLRSYNSTSQDDTTWDNSFWYLDLK